MKTPIFIFLNSDSIPYLKPFFCMTIGTTLTILDVVQTLALLSFLINSSHYNVNIYYRT